MNKAQVYTQTPQYQNDRSIGITKEDELLVYLNTKTPDKYRKFINRFSLFDIFNDEYICEIKTRRNSYKKYPSTMVGYNKVKICEEDKESKYRFYFIFTDGTYYWDFNPSEYLIRAGGRVDRGCQEIKEYCYINIEYLKLLTTEVKSVS